MLVKEHSGHKFFVKLLAHLRNEQQASFDIVGTACLALESAMRLQLSVCCSNFKDRCKKSCRPK